MEPFVSKIPRTFWLVKDLEKYSSNETVDPYPSGIEVCHRTTRRAANTISSLLALKGNQHAPTIDVDWHATLIAHDGNTELIISPDWPKESDGTLVAAQTIDRCLRALVEGGYVAKAYYTTGPSGLYKVVLQFIDPPDMVLLPSKTRGHFHLYIERALPWGVYLDFLRLLMRIGVVQRGFYSMTLRRGMSHLRKPPATAFWVQDQSRPTLF